ncbi:MAG: diguanylate cyclase [Candidatus Niyogibacteria bacterium]|nr:diguanylate cyclase [Candidatus Niyogibacteria bacterium]
MKEKLKQYEYKDFGSQSFKKTEIKALEEKLTEAERENASLRTENKNQKDIIEKLNEELENDYLTGIYNKRHFTKKSEKIVSIISDPESKERREGEIIPVAVSFAIADIDKFKKINDEKGHLEGDRILREVARVFKENTRETDTVCRWGGEEIAMIFFNADLAEAFKKAEELRKIVQKEAGVTVSIGVAEYKKNLSFDEILNQSDQALYLAKNEGRNRVRTYEQVREKKSDNQDKLE